MRTLFIHAKCREKVSLTDDALKTVASVIAKSAPKSSENAAGSEGNDKCRAKLALLSTIQFIESLDSIKKSLESLGICVVLPVMPHSQIKGHLLGCGIKKIKGVDAILLVADGEFHALALVIENNVPCLVFNPFSKKIDVFDNMHERVRRFRNISKAGLAALANAEKVGIIVSLKPGQNRLELALELKRRLYAAGKKAFILLNDNILPSALEDFNFIDCFVNTACPRLGFDDYAMFPKPVADLSAVMQFLDAAGYP